MLDHPGGALSCNIINKLVMQIERNKLILVTQKKCESKQNWVSCSGKS
jgi:hypothetical protein